MKNSYYKFVSETKIGKYLFGKDRFEYLKQQSDNVKKQLANAKTEQERQGIDRRIGFQGGFFGILNKVTSAVMLPMGFVLGKTMKAMPSPRTVFRFGKGLIRGVKNTISFVIGQITKFVRFGINSVKGLVQFPIKMFEKIKGLFRVPFGAGFIKFLSTDEGAIFLGTVMAFFKVFVIDEARRLKADTSGSISDLFNVFAGRVVDDLNQSIVKDWSERFGDNFATIALLYGTDFTKSE